MSVHVVLLVGLDRAFEDIESSIASELERAGYEVVEAHTLSTASALLFIHRRVEAVVIGAATGHLAAELANRVSALRPGLPLLTAEGAEAQRPSDGQVEHKAAMLISTLDGLLHQPDSRQLVAA